MEDRPVGGSRMGPFRVHGGTPTMMGNWSRARRSRSATGSGPASGEGEPAVGEAVGHDLVAAGAAAVLGDVEGAAHLPLGAGPAHEEDRVSVGEDVPLADRLAHQVI